MKIVFMGTPDFAVPSLKILAQHHQVCAVVTVPDKPAGRGQKMRQSDIKKTAIALNIPVLQPESLKDPDFIEQLKSFNAELFFVVAFRILPAVVFTLPSKGTINLHASLLPSFRGAAPINWALINGEKQTGVTTFFIEEKVDTGKILLQQSLDITPNMTAGELHDALAELGAEVVLNTVNGIDNETLSAVIQEGTVTQAPKITKEICEIDWSKSALDIHNFIRGLSPYPAAFTWYKNKNLKNYKVFAA